MSPSPEAPLRIRILSSPELLPVVRAAVETMCQSIGFDERIASKITLSVDEALTNVIRHAYQGARDRPIDLELTPLRPPPSSGLRVTVRDFGRRVDPSVIRSRDLNDVRPGGLGVHIMNCCMDSVEYQPAEGGGTRLVMTKCLCGQEAEKA